MTNIRAVFFLFSLLAWGVAGLGWSDEPTQQGVDATLAERRLNLPNTPFNYSNPEWPLHFLEAVKRFDNTPQDNPLTDHGATLGRVLFYDKTLSVSGTISCASCHQQSLAFTDDAKLSVGHQGKMVRRNSMSLINSRFYQRGRFFWDERAGTLEQQVLMPIIDQIEMGHDLRKLELQIGNDPLYPELFASAFGTAEVTEDRIAKALAQFVRSIVSYQSKYDTGRAAVESIRDPFPNFSDKENEGKEVFLGRSNCAACHLGRRLDEASTADSLEWQQDAFFFVDRPAANGIDDNDPTVDRGVGEVNGSEFDMGRFKSPSLRNIEVTGPFMHDGRFVSIPQVIEHYNWSVRPHPNLDVELVDVPDNGMGIRQTRKNSLVAFLLTLTDHKLLSDPKYSDPFVRE